MSQLKLDGARRGDAYVITLEGELDVKGCSRLEQALTEAEETHARRILLNIEALKFIDSDGLETVYRASQRSSANGSRLRITRGKGNVADMFQLAALDETLPFTKTSPP
jgi:stage II sporulation protein AA (anti-sigma F factor antagonist)